MSLSLDWQPLCIARLASTCDDFAVQSICASYPGPIETVVYRHVLCCIESIVANPRLFSGKSVCLFALYIECIIWKVFYTDKTQDSAN